MWPPPLSAAKVSEIASFLLKKKVKMCIFWKKYSGINLNGLQRCPKESEHPVQTALAEQYIQNMSGAYNKKCAPGAGPTLQLDAAYAPPRTAPG